MIHPPESDLALYAGGDLTWWKQWRTERHLRQCGQCRQRASEYEEARYGWDESLSLNWAPLASEMKANIRLGLAAGECVGIPPASRPMVSGVRLAIAGGLLTVLFAVSAWINRPDLRPVWQRATSGTVLEAAEHGIQVRGVQQTLRILNPASQNNSVSQNVVYTVGSHGELGARSVDPRTGNVAITQVYGE